MKRKGYPSRYDRVQDRKIRKLQQNIVLKQHTTVSSQTLAAESLQFTALNLVPQGETDITREASTIHMVSLAMRWRLVGSAVATTGTGSVRIMIVLDKDPRGALPGATDVLTSNSMLSAYNTGKALGEERNRGRFKFLYDRLFDMPADAIASADQLAASVTGKLYVKLGNARVLFTEDAGAITEIEQHNLFVCAIASGNSQDQSFLFNAVLRFTAPD